MSMSVPASHLTVGYRGVDLDPRNTGLPVKGGCPSSTCNTGCLNEEVLLKQAVLDRVGIFDASTTKLTPINDRGLALLTSSTEVYSFFDVDPGV